MGYDGVIHDGGWNRKKRLLDLLRLINAPDNGGLNNVIGMMYLQTGLKPPTIWTYLRELQGFKFIEYDTDFDTVSVTKPEVIGYMERSLNS